MTKYFLIITIFIFNAVFYHSAAISADVQMEKLKAEYKRPLLIPFPEHAPYSPQIAMLGKKLFFDPRLSGAKNMNCASCHNPSFGFEAPVDLAVGAANEKLGRHAPTTLNMAWVKPLFWDGRAANLEEQAAGPITAPVEMNGKFSEIVPALQDIEEYNKWFGILFPGKGITRETILTAIATYERTIVTNWAPFDKWVDGDDGALSASAQRGFVIFNDKAKCAACHSGWNFTDNKFHDIGGDTEDIGRAELEPNNPLAKHAFKTPGLRNLTQRAPFTHNGSFENLEQIIGHYESGGIQRASLSPLMESFSLNDGERKDLLAFLVSLTAGKSEIPMPILPN